MKKQNLNVLCVAQSQWNGLLTGSNIAPNHPDLVNVILGEDQVASEVSGYSYGVNQAKSCGMAYMANAFHARYPGVILNLLIMHRGNTGYSEWLNATTPSGLYGKATLEAFRRFGKPDIIAAMPGEREAFNPSYITTLLADKKALYGQFLRDFDATSDELQYVGTTLGTPTGANSGDCSTVRELQDEAYATIPGMRKACTLVGLTTKSDGIHITDDAAGAGAVGTAFGDAFADIWCEWQAPKFIHHPIEEEEIALEPIAFKANKNGTNQTGVALETATLVTYSNVIFDVGNCYDETNSKFVAPSDGLYVFHAKGCLSAGMVNEEIGYISLNVNGASPPADMGATVNSGTAREPIISCWSMLELEAGDEVTVKVYFPGSSGGSKTIHGAAHLTSFSGYRYAPL